VATYDVDVELEPWTEGGFVARAPALQGCWVVAETPEQALADIYEGIEMHIAARLRRGESLPVEVAETGGESKVRMRLAVAVS
jgi:predicted RNase H-like HicB family nuclease